MSFPSPYLDIRLKFEFPETICIHLPLFRCAFTSNSNNFYEIKLIKIRHLEITWHSKNSNKKVTLQTRHWKSTYSRDVIINNTFNLLIKRGHAILYEKCRRHSLVCPVSQQLILAPNNGDATKPRRYRMWQRLNLYRHILASFLFKYCVLIVCGRPHVVLLVIRGPQSSWYSGLIDLFVVGFVIKDVGKDAVF